MLEKRRQTELERILSTSIDKLTPEEAILANWQETYFRLCRSGLEHKEATEAMMAFSDPNSGPKEATWKL